MRMPHGVSYVSRYLREGILHILCNNEGVKKDIHVTGRFIDVVLGLAR
jgi:hypothetical protein